MRASSLRKGSLVRAKDGHVACLYTDIKTGDCMLQIVPKEIAKFVFTGSKYLNPTFHEQKELLYIGSKKTKLKKKHMFFIDTKCVELVNRECRHLEFCEEKSYVHE